MNADEWQILGFTLRTAALALLLILPPGVALGWLLALLGRRGPLGAPLHERFGLDVVFTWRGVVAAMAVMSLPLLVRASRVAFEGVETRLEDVARTLGAGELRVLLTITLPLAARGLLGGALLAFARALGEFGATIVVAGNIPGRTTTLALAIFQRIQLGEDGAALRLMAAAVVVAFVAVWLGEVLLRRGGPAA
jgi:molybdate transport system permease protein